MIRRKVVGSVVGLKNHVRIVWLLELQLECAVVHSSEDVFSFNLLL